jgi:hypothetical protein
VAVQRARQHADRLDDLAHRRRREAALRECARRRVEQVRQAARRPSRADVRGGGGRATAADIAALEQTNTCLVKREGDAPSLVAGDGHGLPRSVAASRARQRSSRLAGSATAHRCGRCGEKSSLADLDEAAPEAARPSRGSAARQTRATSSSGRIGASRAPARKRTSRRVGTKPSPMSTAYGSPA